MYKQIRLKEVNITTKVLNGVIKSEGISKSNLKAKAAKAERTIITPSKNIRGIILLPNNNLLHLPKYMPISD